MVERTGLPKLPEVLYLSPRRFADSRGYFAETFRHQWLADVLGVAAFCQDNESFSAQAGTVRGLHFQRPPYGQGKLVRVLRGSIWDVAVDIRASSPTYGQWDGMGLSAERGDMLYIPNGFAHGFITLEDEVQVAYKCTAYYDPGSEGSIHYADGDLAIDWPRVGRAPSLSDKDQTAPAFAELEPLFL